MKGTSYTYFTTDNAKSARELLAILREAKATVPPQLEEMSMFGGGGARSQPITTTSYLGPSLTTLQVDTAPMEEGVAEEADSVGVGTMTGTEVVVGNAGDAR
jgi:hypothetical protein